jgi:lanosterol synthase
LFAVRALVAAGVVASDEAIAGAGEWLRRTQKTDGGWGEHWQSCRTGIYQEHPESQAAMTAWAVLTLRLVVDVDDPTVVRGVAALCSMRDRTGGGGWHVQAGSSVFFGTAVLDHGMYKDVFPTWTLASGETHAGSDPGRPRSEP